MRPDRVAALKGPTMSLKTKMTALFTASALALGTFGISASPAAALGQKDRQALTVILGVGAAALLLDSANNNRRQVRRAPPRVVYREVHRNPPRVERRIDRRIDRRVDRRLDAHDRRYESRR
jgi:hypothetical protein